MTTSLGAGRLKPPLLALVPWRNVFELGPAGDDTGRTMAEEWYLGGYPPAAVQVPISWVSPPFTVRQDTPLDVAEVTRGSTTVRSKNQTVVTANRGREWTFTETLDSVAPVDAPSLAKWVTDTYTGGRPRSPGLTLVLNARTEAEIYKILSVRQGTRVSLTGAPASWPTGATEHVVEGVRHTALGDIRTVVWVTTPVIGATAGVPGPWFTLGETHTTSTTDLVPF